MRARLFAILFLGLFLFPGDLAAQGMEVTVRLCWLREVRKVRIAPLEDGVRVQLCEGCTPVAVAQPADIRFTDGRLRVGARAAEKDTAEFTGHYRIEVPGHPPVTLAHAMAVRAEAGRLALVVRLPLEEYVAAVLAGESSAFSSVEALKAMAVAARTYAAHYRGRHREEGFDLCDTTHCQDVRLTAVSDRLRAPVAETEGELLWFAGRPAATYYHRDCGGTTEAAERLWPAAQAAYLRQQSDSYCVQQGRNEWRSSLSREELRRALTQAGFELPDEMQSVEVIARTPSGRVARLRLYGVSSLQVPADAFRLAVGGAVGWDRIRSDLYDLRAAGDRFLVHGYGAGHGVGLCQTGAARMGELGRSYREILGFYYPGTALGLTAAGLHWQALAGERVELLTTRPAQEGFLAGLAERQLRELEQATGWSLAARPQIRVYPSVEIYRNATGKPGWVNASTSGRIVRMQPAETLRAAGNLEETLRHELLHLLVESRAHRSLPLWFREGIVLALPGSRQPASPSRAALDPASVDQVLARARTEAEMRRAYASARALVQLLLAQHGRETVLGWVERGLPPGLVESLSGSR